MFTLLSKDARVRTSQLAILFCFWFGGFGEMIHVSLFLLLLCGGS